MLTALRTYRLLSTVLGLSLLLSAVLPLVQTACDMGQYDVRGAHACHSEGVPSYESTIALMSHCAQESDAMHEGVVPFMFDTPPCCAFEPASTVETTAFLSKTSWRGSYGPLFALLPHTAYKSIGNASRLTRASASRHFFGFPPIDRQALLATFLT